MTGRMRGQSIEHRTEGEVGKEQALIRQGGVTLSNRSKEARTVD